jgi:VWFA-related protein
MASPFAPSTEAIDGTEGLIKLDVVVTDNSGKPVTDLIPDDFQLLDNGQPQKIVSFQAWDFSSVKPNPPVEVVLVIDELDLPPLQLSAAEREAEKFLAENRGHLDLPVVTYRISQAGLSVSAEPSGTALMDSAMDLKWAPRWIWQTRNVVASQGWGAGDGVFLPTDHNPPDTALLNHLPHSVIALGSIAIEERRKPGRKLLFWLGPGWPFGRNPGVNLFDLGPRCRRDCEKLASRYGMQRNGPCMIRGPASRWRIRRRRSCIRILSTG